MEEVGGELTLGHKEPRSHKEGQLAPGPQLYAIFPLRPLWLLIAGSQTGYL